MSEDISYENEIIKKGNDVMYALRYYIDRCKLLEKENQRLCEMYEHRVEEYIKITMKG